MKVIFDDVSNKTAVVLNQAIAMSLNTNKLQVVPQGRTTIKFIYLGSDPDEKNIYVDLWVNHICQLVTREGFPLNYEIKDDTITFIGILNKKEGVLNNTKPKRKAK